MPKNPNIKKVVVIGSGPIVIGQAAEFDYAGTQACRSLKEEGLCVVLINSNPATIMTDKDIADKVYIEPLTVDVVKAIIEKEKPDSLLPTLGGQAALNIAMELDESGFLREHDVLLIGTSSTTIKKAEDRLEFKKTMEKIHEPVAPSEVVTTVQGGLNFVKKIGYPVVLRPAYTLGGSGGGIANNEEEFKEILMNGLRLSRVGQVLVDAALLAVGKGTLDALARRGRIDRRVNGIGHSLPPLLLGNQTDDAHQRGGDDKQDHTHAEQRRAVQTRGIAHVERNLARERRDGARNAVGNNRGVTYDHEHGHGLADGTAHTQHDGINDTQLRGR